MSVDIVSIDDELLHRGIHAANVFFSSVRPSGISPPCTGPQRRPQDRPSRRPRVLILATIATHVRRRFLAVDFAAATLELRGIVTGAYRSCPDGFLDLRLGAERKRLGFESRSISVTGDELEPRFGRRVCLRQPSSSPRARPCVDARKRHWRRVECCVTNVLREAARLRPPAPRCRSAPPRHSAAAYPGRPADGPPWPARRTAPPRLRLRARRRQPQR